MSQEKLDSFKLLICGGRNYGNIKLVPRDSSGNYDRNSPIFHLKRDEYLNVCSNIDKVIIEKGMTEPEYNMPLPELCIIHGGATGADTCADDWCVINFHTNVRVYPADWNKYGKRAGIIRNIEMLDKETPDMVLAFPGGVGTAHMVREARARGIEVREVK